MNEFVLGRNNYLSDKVYDSQKIKNGFQESFDLRANEIVSNIAGLIPTIENLKEIIDPQKTYVAQFPKEIIEKMQSGQYDLMQSKSGEILSMIVDKTLPKNKNIIHNVRLTEADPNVLGKVQNLSNNVVNLAVQQQLAQVLEELSEVKKLVTSIKRGQVTDRIGKVYAGKRLLEDALDGPSKIRDSQIQSAIGMLEEGRTQLELYLYDELKLIKDVPTSKLKIFFNSLFNNGFYDKSEESYYSFQEGFQAYLDSCIYLSMAYNEIRNEKAMLRAFEPAKSLIQKASPKIKLLSEITISGNEEDNLIWYRNTDQIIKKINDYPQKTLLKAADVINIEFEGRHLIT